MSLLDRKISEVKELLHKKEVTVSDLVDQSLARINEVEEKVKAFITVDEENARAQAKKLDEQIGTDASNQALFGIPSGIKDNIVTKNLVTTCASKMLENFDPIYNATVMEKLNSKGTVTIGKTNMDEFAMGSTTETSFFHPTYNPWNLDFVPGGSSGGSAAAVAAGEVMFSLGTDTGGSIRQPAAFCGVVGLKPTYGRVSRSGVVAFASSFDQVGPITRTVEDNAVVLEAISGHDDRDSTSIKREVPNYVNSLTGDVRGLKIAVPKEYIGEGVSEESKKAVLAALKVLEGLGATWEEVSLPYSKYGLASYYIVTSSEASSNLARFDGVRYGYRTENPKNLLDLYKKTRSEGFGDEVKRRIMLGTFALSAGYYDAYYKKAQQARALIKQDFDNVLSKYDVVIGPTTPTPAYKMGEVVDDIMTMYAGDLLTIPVNLAGLPAISVPCGYSNGLPLGLQIIGNYFDEETIYRVAHAFEQATNYHEQKPQL
ncbi:Asp-tRNA(Asn)/Glu-tRNA(Gln) amidotransferase subunit GatA [Siminovitchia fortis]|uniref:Glutamyl-tRNA(Gln) amidotransferase subunit A n=1 Tax=Siminovitchia fortis TaxID=254758 RepID=A0A443ILH5_9BACI|nr:Asp-tRNA(Asn)/Glu-tRNA(Gln) amidotransferase subunit GatA [Siminovitchia fortis]RWR05796.1 Asp-tRNA(Asn)/Glu-tRNA(Gln) amidotransferase subunit GatA [Siminovitchia fortis]WHY80599.1 Asp-tRNA(Asn)/Glu-tRNA(Gln) amidotransferase subunit GatA [Siminovitchia fortis]